MGKYKKDYNHNKDSYNRQSSNSAADYFASTYFLTSSDTDVEIYNPDTDSALWNPVSGTNLTIPFRRSDSFKVFTFSYINFLPMTNLQVLQYMDPYHQALYNIWGEDSFRFRRTAFRPFQPPPSPNDPDLPNITTMTAETFLNTPFAINVEDAMRKFKATDSFFALLPLPGFTNATAVTTSVYDPSRQSNFFTITFAGTDLTPEVFAHEWGHAMFIRNDNGVLTMKNPYTSQEFNSLTPEQKFNVRGDATHKPDIIHNYTPGNVMRPKVGSNVVATSLQKDKAWNSPLGSYRPK